MPNLPTPLPTDDETPLIRTDFTDQAAWQALWTAVSTPNEDDFAAVLHLVDDPAYAEVPIEDIEAAMPEYGLVVLADTEALTAPGMPLLVLHRTDDGAQRLRVIASELWSVENNMSLANMDWEDFTDAADDDGGFRGF